MVRLKINMTERIMNYSKMIVAINVVMFKFSIGLFVLLNLLEGIPLGRRKNMLKEDLLCNIDDDHECVCNRSTGNLDATHMPCHEFVETRKLDVVSMVLRDVNLNARLYTNETYEQYLRRRISQIMSQYCENMPEDCPGTLAEIRSQQQQKKASIYEVDEKTVTVLDDGPVFSRGNIVILRVRYPPGKGRISLSFVVLKMANTVGINSGLILYPTTVKYILSAQSAPLSRVLGGVRIEQFGIDTLVKPMTTVDNTRLIIIIIVIAVLIIICCTIAVVKVFMDRAARRQKRHNKETLTEKESNRNYGTCTEKLFSNSKNHEIPNGRAKSKSVCSRESNNSKKTKRENKVSKCSNEMPSKIVVEETTATAANNEEDISPRAAYQNIFICDHSQLPKEDVDEEFEMEVKRIKRRSLNVHQQMRSPFSSDDDGATGFQGFQFPERLPNHEGEKRFSFSENIPCVILDGGDRSEEEKEDTSLLMGQPIFQLNLTPKSCGGGSFLSTVNEAVERPQSRLGEGHPFDRPLSRRGSRDETQEEGEEETFNDTREDTPVPLGDDQVLVEKPLIDMLKEKSKKIVEKLFLTSETDSEDEEEERGEDEGNTLYKPLKNEENCMRLKVKGNGSSSESEERIDENEVLERHHYERLLDSPMPPATDNEQKPTPKIILND